MSINHKFKPVSKDRLFYDKFHYSLGFYLQEVNCLRVLDHAHIDDMIQRRQHWRDIAQMRWMNHSGNLGTIMSRRHKEITAQTVEHLHVLADMFLHAKHEFKLVVSVNQGHVYSNDLEFLQQLDVLPMLEYKSYGQAQIVRPKNTVSLKNPKHKFRTYLKFVKLSHQQKDHLESFLTNHQNDVRVSPALQRWIDQPLNRTQDYFFVDHDTQQWLTLLNLVSPGIIRKTMHIIPAK